ncbi:hypothetical protein L596_026897 [Steinernema carpocapsae]|uniref:Exonuclease domain-containing protein n=1 Tax=Steinernema carpocapsae TaxID=34508 RepID=A0A4U5M2P4_STECR|nr:hypothetical protein L596_026897 [Steinernema carpocapsae]
MAFSRLGLYHSATRALAPYPNFISADSDSADDVETIGIGSSVYMITNPEEFDYVHYRAARKQSVRKFATHRERFHAIGVYKKKLATWVPPLNATMDTASSLRACQATSASVDPLKILPTPYVEPIVFHEFSNCHSFGAISPAPSRFKERKLHGICQDSILIPKWKQGERLETPPPVDDSDEDDGPCNCLINHWWYMEPCNEAMLDVIGPSACHCAEESNACYSNCYCWCNLKVKDEDEDKDKNNDKDKKKNEEEENAKRIAKAKAYYLSILGTLYERPLTITKSASSVRSCCEGFQVPAKNDQNAISDLLAKSAFLTKMNLQKELEQLQVNASHVYPFGQHNFGGLMKSYAIDDDGLWELRNFLQMEFVRSEQHYAKIAHHFRAYINSHALNKVNLAGMEFQGREHCALDDAISLAIRMMEDRAESRVNEKLVAAEYADKYAHNLDHRDELSGARSSQVALVSHL